MELFDAFSIGVVLKDINEQVNSLVVEAATLQSCNDMLQEKCKMELVIRPLVLDDYDHWQIFHDDAEIVRVLANLKGFSDYSWQGEGETTLGLLVMSLKKNKFPHFFGENL